MILDGKIVAADIKQRLKEEINGRVDIIGRRPKLEIISVGNDSTSKVYIRNKIKAAEEVGIEVNHLIYGSNENPQRVMDYINMLNYADCVDGIMVQLPLPKHWNEREIINSIHPDKDVATDKAIRMVQGITPVPDGVGPITIAELMSNTVEAWRNNTKGS
jgi:methylenetetrahydrofolate dehydrogenase (NADP+)/methenyltetrahydrofolate cyclohydrolase